MSQPKIVAGLFFMAAFIWLFVAILPALRHGDLNITFFALAMLHFILGLAKLEEVRRGDGSPPA